MGTYLYKLPDIGEGVVEAEITAWHVAIGDTVSEEDPIADAMTDKATIELTSPVDGVIKSMACKEGDMLAVGAVLVSLEIEGEGQAEEPELEQKFHSEPIPEAPVKLTPASPPAAPVTRNKSGGKVLASPAVRKRAASLNIDLSDVPTEGARVSHADLDAFLMQGASASPDPTPETSQLASSSPQMESSPASSTSSSRSAKVRDTPLSTDPIMTGETRHKVIGLRRVIATRMAESKRNIPHFTYVEEMDVTALEEMRGRMNTLKQDDKPKLTVLPFIIRALAVTLTDWPQFNARYDRPSRRSRADEPAVDGRSHRRNDNADLAWPARRHCDNARN